MAIGGYLELELNDGVEYHPTAIKLNTGTNAFEYILRTKEYKEVFIPYYACESLLIPIKRLGLVHHFYNIDKNLEPVILPQSLNKHQAFVYINYNGLKDHFIKFLAGKIDNLIIDNVHAFFSRPIDNVDTFYSARKFFGVPDGAYLYTNKPLPQDLEMDISSDRLTHLTRRIESGPEAGYPFYLENENLFDNIALRKMSKLTNRLLKNIDYTRAAKKRRENFLALEEKLDNLNIFHFKLQTDQVPMFYPLFTEMEGMRDYLIREMIFVPQYWPNVMKWASSNSLEYKIALNMMPLPIDQRYSVNEMESVANAVLKFIGITNFAK